MRFQMDDDAKRIRRANGTTKSPYDLVGAASYMIWQVATQEVPSTHIDVWDRWFDNHPDGWVE